MSSIILPAIVSSIAAPAIVPSIAVNIDPFEYNPSYEEYRNNYIDNGTEKIRTYLIDSFINEDVAYKAILSKKDKIDHITKKFKDSYRLNPSFINRIDDLMDEDTLDEEDIDVNIESFDTLYDLLSDISFKKLSIGITNDGNATISQDNGINYFYARIKNENEVFYNILKDDYPKTDLLATDTLSKFKKSLNEYGFINYAYS